MLKKFIVFLIIVSSISFATIDSFEYTSPTDNDSVIITNRNWTYINVSVTNSSAVDTFTIEWNGTNITAWGSGLVGLWHLDNSTLDSSEKGIDGTGTGNLNCSNAVAGKFNSGCHFDGTNSDIRLENNIYNSMSEGTIEFWVNYNEDGNTHTIFTGSMLTDNSNAVTIVIPSGGEAYIFTRINGVNEYVGRLSGATVQPNQWTHVAWTKTGTTHNIYLNGEPQNITWSPDSDRDAYFYNLSGTVGYTIGNYRRTTNANFLNGTIDELRIWNRSLTADEIGILWRSEIGQYYANITDNPDGIYTYNAYINDTAGNENSTGQRIVTFVPDVIQNFTLASLENHLYWIRANWTNYLNWDVRLEVYPIDNGTKLGIAQNLSFTDTDSEAIIDGLRDEFTYNISLIGTMGSLNSVTSLLINTEDINMEELAIVGSLGIMAIIFYLISKNLSFGSNAGMFVSMIVPGLKNLFFFSSLILVLTMGATSIELASAAGLTTVGNILQPAFTIATYTSILAVVFYGFALIFNVIKVLFMDLYTNKRKNQ